MDRNKTAARVVVRMGMSVLGWVVLGWAALGPGALKAAAQPQRYWVGPTPPAVPTQPPRETVRTVVLEVHEPSPRPAARLRIDVGLAGHGFSGGALRPGLFASLGAAFPHVDLALRVATMRRAPASAPDARESGRVALGVDLAWRLLSGVWCTPVIGAAFDVWRVDVGSEPAWRPAVAGRVGVELTLLDVGRDSPGFVAGLDLVGRRAVRGWTFGSVDALGDGVVPVLSLETRLGYRF